MKGAAGGEYWHESDKDYAAIEVGRHWNVWQAKRKAGRLGGEWREYLRGAVAVPKCNHTKRALEVVEAPCMECGVKCSRKRYSMETSLKKRGGVLCKKCHYKRTGMAKGHKKAKVGE